MCPAFYNNPFYISSQKFVNFLSYRQCQFHGADYQFSLRDDVDARGGTISETAFSSSSGNTVFVYNLSQ